MNNSQINIPDISELNIYEGGTLNEIKITDLKGNEVAIKQLINSHNIKIKELHLAQSSIANLNSDLEYHKTAPFISIVALLVNLSGSTVSSLGVNFLSSEKPPRYSSLLLITGIALIVIGSLSTILYPYARSFFNRK